jgi:hypothetical protein
MSSFLSMKTLKLNTEVNHTLFRTGADAKQLQEASEWNDKNHIRKSVNPQAPARQAVHLQRIEVEAGKRRTKEATKEHLWVPLPARLQTSQKCVSLQEEQYACSKDQQGQRNHSFPNAKT